MSCFLLKQAWINTWSQEVSAKQQCLMHPGTIFRKLTLYHMFWAGNGVFKVILTFEKQLQMSGLWLQYMKKRSIRKHPVIAKSKWVFLFLLSSFCLHVWIQTLMLKALKPVSRLGRWVSFPITVLFHHCCPAQLWSECAVHTDETSDPWMSLSQFYFVTSLPFFLFFEMKL